MFLSQTKLESNPQAIRSVCWLLEVKEQNIITFFWLFWRSLASPVVSLLLQLEEPGTYSCNVTVVETTFSCLTTVIGEYFGDLCNLNVTIVIIHRQTIPNHFPKILERFLKISWLLIGVINFKRTLFDTTM